MFLLKKIIAAFVLPPGCLVVGLAGVAVYLRKRSRPAAIFCAAMGVLTWVGATKAFSDALMGRLESAYTAPAKPDGDIIVVLGGGARTSSGYSASEALSQASLERASTAAHLQKKTGLPVLITGGAPASAQAESVLMARYLEETGVPHKSIITEEASRNTFENAEFSLKICEEKGYKRVILVTSAYHMPRAVLLFRKAGGEVTPFPVAKRVAPGGYRSVRDYLPGNDGDVSKALNEYLGLLTYKFYYSFQGTKKGKM